MEDTKEIIVAASENDVGICGWDLHSGAVRFRVRQGASPPHGLTSVGGRFFAASQIRKSASSAVFYSYWNKSQAEVKSFLEPIKPITSNSTGTYILGGGSFGAIYLWEVASGRLLKKWSAHFKGLSCLRFAEDESLIISGSEDGSVKVWSLIKVLDDSGLFEHENPFEHNIQAHSLPVTDIFCGYGGSNAIVVSSSEDCTCKIWSLNTGVVLKTITFPTKVLTVVVDPGEYVLYAGSDDGNVYIAAVNCPQPTHSAYGEDIICALSDHSEAVTCLGLSINGNLLISGSKDGTIRVWDAINRQVTQILKHEKGPISNILVVRWPLSLNTHASIARHRVLPPQLERYPSQEVDNLGRSVQLDPVVSLQNRFDDKLNKQFITSYDVFNKHIKIVQQPATDEKDLESLKAEYKRSLQMLDHWQHVYEDLHGFCVNELMNHDSGQGQ